MTERLTKQKIKDLLAVYGERVYYNMPVPGGYGRSTLDFIGCANGWFFGIEAKAWATKKKPTERQEGIIEDMESAGGVVFRIRDQESLNSLSIWLRDVMEIVHA